ncbi:nucleoside hydrolase [Mucilaginibacter sp. dw_454]|uniref:nucleoside hydrolase n=1 Tax=Mucilaginibacter sp. dw_454 TaxID=2720079 RepID=UPI001BD6C2FC|nr:nucleoside hydrolase [Mucilaginibacter sp. dw_454]
MKIRSFLLLVAFCFAMNALAQKRTKPVNIIFDSDIGPDYDDVGAITILHALADKGEANILATMASNRYEGIAAVLNVFNTYFKRPDLPIGVAGQKAVNARDGQHWTDTILARYPHTIKTNADAWDAVKLYRKILAAQPDHSVTIVTIGFLTNISDLLNSSADEYSKLSGKELIQKKVKQLVSMAGRFPSGNEFNVIMDAPAANNVFQNIDISIIYSGFEIGEKIKVGLPLINDASIKNSPVKDVFSIAMSKSKDDAGGRMSWDETAVLVAIKGSEPYYDLYPGKMAPLAADGKNTWDDNGKGQAYLTEKIDHQQVQDLINQLIMHQPKK